MLLRCQRGLAQQRILLVGRPPPATAALIWADMIVTVSVSAARAFLFQELLLLQLCGCCRATTAAAWSLSVCRSHRHNDCLSSNTKQKELFDGSN
jgi:hypothetical protein